ncbi:uncharacterized protein TNCV_5067371 [Trichonephila clavipes]|nr:uncharacterized protein TNCV_5067371 [Trichonephila clavipes]
MIFKEFGYHRLFIEPGPLPKPGTRSFFVCASTDAVLAIEGVLFMDGGKLQPLLFTGLEHLKLGYRRQSSQGSQSTQAPPERQAKDTNADIHFPQDQGLDSRTSNGKLWKLLKHFSNEQPQAEQCNTVLSENGNLAVNDEQAANLLGLHYQKISRLNFSVEDRKIKIRASRNVHDCRSDTHRGISIFSRDFRVIELEATMGDSCLNKSPCPDDIHS